MEAIRLFDTHAHLLDGRFDEDREALVSGLPARGVACVLEAACEAADIPRVIALCERHPGLVYGAAGIHPHSASGFTGETLAQIESALAHPAIRAVGEIGLDYHYDFSPREAQKACFDAQLALAGRRGRPVVIHDREAHGDCLDLLREHRDGLQGVMHCFSGSYEMARACLDLGLYLGIGGSLTFKNAKKLLETVQKAPRDRLLLETDCPYMTPEPFRGRRNDSTHVHLVAETIAQIKGTDPEEVARVTLENGRRFFRI